MDWETLGIKEATVKALWADPMLRAAIDRLHKAAVAAYNDAQSEVGVALADLVAMVRDPSSPVMARVSFTERMTLTAFAGMLHAVFALKR